MKDEEKSRELAIKYCKDIDYKGRECYNIGCEAACNEMAEYKDEQFKHFLNSLLMQSNIRQIYSLIEEKLKNL